MTESRTDAVHCLTGRESAPGPKPARSAARSPRDWPRRAPANRRRWRRAAVNPAGRGPRDSAPTRPRRASGTTSSSAVGRRKGCSEPVVHPAHVEQVVDQPFEPVRALLDGGEQRRLVLGRPGHVALAQAGDGRFDRRQRGAQVVADGGQQCGPYAIGLAEYLRLGCLGTQALAVEGGCGLGADSLQHAATHVGRLAGQPEAQIGTEHQHRDGFARADPVSGHAAGGHLDPATGDALEQLRPGGRGGGELGEH